MLPNSHGLCHLLSVRAALQGAGGLLVFIVVFFSLRIIYRIYFHPLSVYPGPRLWAASRLPWNVTNLQGRLAWAIKDLHERYGPVVRIAPDELSYAGGRDGGAWRAIYGKRSPEFSKCLDGRGIAGPNMRHAEKGIVTAPQAKHARLRRAIAPAFSERALREQEDVLQLYAGKLVEQLKRSCRAAPGGQQCPPPQDMMRWYNLLSFDIMSDLAFGQPAGCLDTADQPWLQVMGSRTKSVVWYQFIVYYGLSRFAQLLTPKTLAQARAKHAKLVHDKVQRRVNSPDTSRRDFLSYVLGEKTETLSSSELALMASSFIVAGSGTTSSAMAGTTYFLCRSRDSYLRLAAEVRSAFGSEADITIESTSRLSYLKAVIEEGLRMYPPSPGTFPRFVPGRGEEIEGRWVPGGTAVGVHQFAASRMEYNFRHANSFIPERWLPLSRDSEFANDNRAAMQPFSFGPRNCIGVNMAYAEMRLILAKLIWNFDLELVDNSDKWMDEHKSFLMWEKMPLLVHLKPRNSGN